MLLQSYAVNLSVKCLHLIGILYPLLILETRDTWYTMLKLVYNITIYYMVLREREYICIINNNNKEVDDKIQHFESEIINQYNKLKENNIMTVFTLILFMFWVILTKCYPKY